MRRPVRHGVSAMEATLVTVPLKNLDDEKEVARATSRAFRRVRKGVKRKSLVCVLRDRSLLLLTSVRPKMIPGMLLVKKHVQLKGEP